MDHLRKTQALIFAAKELLRDLDWAGRVPKHDYDALRDALKGLDP